MDQEQYNYEEYNEEDINNYYEQDPEVPGEYDHPSYSNDEPMNIEVIAHEIQEKPYEILPLFKLFSELDIILDQIRSLIYLDKGWCLELLKEFRWDKDVLKEEYYNNMNQHLSKVGYRPDLKSPQDIDRGTIGMCGVCCSEDIRLFFNICDHNFCIECWIEHLKNSIQSASAFPKCMAGDCPHPVLYQTILRMFALYGQEGEIWFKKYEKKICEQFITTNQNYQFCTGIDCGNCIKVNIKLDTVICTCSKVFCFRCQSDDHYPCKCQQKVKWMQQVMKEEADAKWIAQNAKICPWCKKAVERSMGCNFMACTCGKSFCYMCSKPWQPDHKDHFKCHIYKQRPDDVISRQKEIMEKMNHCTERFIFNQSVANNYKEIDVFSKRKQLFKMLKIDLTESQFMENAYRFAIECCQKLKWIYAFTYFHDCSKQRKEAFQFTLGEYERYKQNLLKMLAVDFRGFFQKIEEQEVEGSLVYQIEMWKQQFRRLKKIIVNNYNCTKNFKEKFVEELKGITQEMDKEKEREELQKYVQSNPALKLKNSKSIDKPQLKKKNTDQNAEQSEQSSKKGLVQIVFGSRKKKK